MTHKVLFICGKNRLRSPTAEQVFADWPGIETASAGTSHDADCVVCAELIAWADTVLVMEASHRAKIAAKSQPELRGKRVAVRSVRSNQPPRLCSCLVPPGCGRAAAACKQRYGGLA